MISEPPRTTSNPFFIGRSRWKDKSPLLAFDASAATAAAAATPATRIFQLYLESVFVSGGCLSQRTCADLFRWLYFRAMNARLIRLLYWEVRFRFLFNGCDWTRVILHDLGVVSPNLCLNPNPNRVAQKEVTHKDSLRLILPRRRRMCEDNCQGSRLLDSLMTKPFHHIFHFTFHIAFF